MNRVSRVVGFRGDNRQLQENGAAMADDPLLDDYQDRADQDTLPPLDLDAGYELDAPGTPILVRLAQFAVPLAAAGWIGLVLLAWQQRDFVMPPVDTLPSAIATTSIPLVLLSVIWLLIMRSSLNEAARFSRISAKLRHESDALDMRLAIVNQQLDTARATLQEQASLLEQYGVSATTNLETSANLLGQHVTTAAHHAESLAQSGTILSRQFGQIVETMPVLEEKAAGISGTLANGSHDLADKVDKLENKLESLVSLIEDARTKTLSASKSLTAQLLQVQDASRSASDELTGMAELSASRLGTAVDRAKQAMDESGLALDMRMADLNVLVDRSRTALDAIGGNAVSAFGDAIDMIETRLHELNRLIEGQCQLVSGLDQDLVGKIDRAEERFTSFEAEGLARNERLSHALGAISSQALQLDEALQAGNQTAEKLIARSEALLLALDASVRELDESHPAALSRLNERIDQSRALLAAATPEIEGLEAVAQSIFGRTQEAEELLRGQSRRLAQWLEDSEGAIASNQEQVRALEDALQTADETARRLTDSSGPQLVAALLRIKDTADHAAERARQALNRAIPDAAEHLGEATEAALNQVLGERISARIEEVNAVAERAVKAAHTASDRLMRQLLTIADTSASVEGRIKEAEEAAEARDKDHFARRSAMLIESLNSAAIDISKSLSGDVSDSSWGAYLKGDRGVFTRRAVRLLDSGEARAVSTLYDENETFRDQVNRYIHDFESMLRGVLSVRDGSALGVTILSSDMGKLYVALAQAIDRLRS